MQENIKSSCRQLAIVAAVLIPLLGSNLALAQNGGTQQADMELNGRLQ